jgi:hypothetical protein
VCGFPVHFVLTAGHPRPRGILQADENSYACSGYDVAGKALLLEDPFTEALSEGDEVLSLSALGRSESSWVAEVLIDEDDEEPIEAEMPTGMRGFSPLARRMPARLSRCTRRRRDTAWPRARCNLTRWTARSFATHSFQVA